MSSSKLIETQILNPSNLNCKLFSKQKTETDRIDVLVVSFYGLYPNGSKGKAHGRFIASKAIEGLMNFEAEAIVLDFRELNYNYGNTLLKVFQDIAQFKDAGNEENEPNFPVLVVASEKSKNAILSLLTPFDSDKIPDWFFEDIDKAISSATEKGQFWLDN